MRKRDNRTAETVAKYGRDVYRSPDDLSDAHKQTRCSCDIFDIGPRCGFCVTECSAAGHPHTDQVTNGQHHMCGVIL